MDCTQDIQDVVREVQNGFHYETNHRIRSCKIEKLYKQWRRDLANEDYKYLSVREHQRLPTRTEWKWETSRKENICVPVVNSNEGNIMSSKNFQPSNYVVKCSPSMPKLPPFRTGKYVPKDDVYSCSVQNEKAVYSSSRGKDSFEKVVSGSNSPPPFRTGKYTPKDGTVYSSSDDKASVQQTSPSHKGKSVPCEKNVGKVDVMCRSGRKSPMSQRRRSQGEKSFSKEANEISAISHWHASNRRSGKFGLKDRICQSAETVGRSTRKHPGNHPVENPVNTRVKTRSENTLYVTCSSRPKSSVLENSSHAFRAIAREINLGNTDKARSVGKIQNRPKSAVLESSLSRRMPMRIVSGTKCQASFGKSLVLDTSPSRESNRYLRKGSDSSDLGHPRSKTTTSISSSCSERTYNALKHRKPRRMLHRNAAYVKPRKTRNAVPLQRKTGSSRKKPAQATKKERVLSGALDGCIPEKTSASVKHVVISLFTDKYAIRTGKRNGQDRIPTAKKCRVMVWKIKRISYLLYEKVPVFLNDHFMLLH